MGEGKVPIKYDEQRSWRTKWEEVDYGLVMRDETWINTNLRTFQIHQSSSFSGIILNHWFE